VVNYESTKQYVELRIYSEFCGGLHHSQQLAQEMECVQKLKELLNTMDEVETAYKQMVGIEMCATKILARIICYERSNINGT
jgi:hypothetical protein